jgi:hypothetical protein
MADEPKAVAKPETPAPAESFFDNDEGKTDFQADPAAVDFVGDDGEVLTDGAPAALAVTEPEPAAPPQTTKQDDATHAELTPNAPQTLDDPNQQLPTGRPAPHDDSELARLRQQVAEAAKRDADQLAIQQLAQETQTFVRTMQSQGLGEETVEKAAAAFQQGRQRELQTLRSAETFISNDRAKVELAHQLAEKHNLGIAGAKTLLIYDTPESMSAAATSAARIAALETGVSEVKQTQVKAQQFDDAGTVGPAPNTKLKLETRYANGEELNDSELATIFPDIYGRS